MFTDDQRPAIREMVLKSQGWKVIDMLLRKRVELLTKQLVDSDDQEKRGRIKELDQLLRNIDKFSQK